MIMLIISIPFSLKQLHLRSASYLEPHLEIDRECHLRTKIYDRRDDFNIPIAKFPFISISILVAPAYGAYISQLIRYFRACGS